VTRGKQIPEPSEDRGAIIEDPSFPLNMLYNCYLACNKCFLTNKLIKNGGHVCSENVLVVQNKRTSQFFQVRERTNHSAFFGNYKICLDFNRCPRREQCSFAHNEPEMILWTEEKKGKFSITEFISRVRSRLNGAERNPLQIFFDKYPGHLLFVCRLCFTSSNRLVLQGTDDITLCTYKRHPWKTSAILAHRMSSTSGITLIGQRPTNAKIVYYGQCPSLQYCPKKWTIECNKAHSFLELELWYVERCLNMTQHQLEKEVCISM